MGQRGPAPARARPDGRARTGPPGRRPRRPDPPDRAHPAPARIAGHAMSPETSMIDVDQITELLEDLVTGAAQRGTVTPTEVMDALTDLDFSPEQLEEVYGLVRGKGLE